MKKISKTPLALAMGMTLPLTVAANSAENPFALNDLSAGYMQTAEAGKDGADKMKDGACGEGKCGASMMKKDSNTAADKKAMEGKCAGNKSATPPTPAGSTAPAPTK